MNRFLRNLVSLVVIVTAILGLRIHERSTALAETREELAEHCSNDSDCLEVLQSRFPSCFEQSFELGNRRGASRLDTSQMATCLNDGSATAFFGVID
ncbi:MAG: hypothetical protein AAGK22_01005 [Acidobacteriota bacterium]